MRGGCGGFVKLTSWRRGLYTFYACLSHLHVAILWITEFCKSTTLKIDFDIYQFWKLACMTSLTPLWCRKSCTRRLGMYQKHYSCAKYHTRSLNGIQRAETRATIEFAWAFSKYVRNNFPCTYEWTLNARAAQTNLCTHARTTEALYARVAHTHACAGMYIRVCLYTHDTHIHTCALAWLVFVVGGGRTCRGSM